MIKSLTAAVLILLAPFFLSTCKNTTDDETSAANTDTTVTDTAALAIAALSASNITFASGDNSGAITQNFTLPLTVSANGSSYAVTWAEKSDGGNNVYLGNSGLVTVTRSLSKVTVILQASVTADGKSAAKDFSFVILAAATGILSGKATYNDIDTTPATGNVSGAALALSSSTDTNLTTILYSASTDSAGAYSFAVPGASYNLYYRTDYSTKMLPNPPADWFFGVNVTANNGGGTNIPLTSGSAVAWGGTTNYRTTDAITVTNGTTTTINFVVEGY